MNPTHNDSAELGHGTVYASLGPKLSTPLDPRSATTACSADKWLVPALVGTCAYAYRA